uniref:Putative endonuclease/reverse transcript n=1 Tax=Ixodes ricinus TaxID=34613 RepID=A0A6B0V2I1_IXORI
MAWTVNAASLFMMLGLCLADDNFTKPLNDIHQYTQIIENLFKVPKTYYVVGGTFDNDPLMDPSLYPFKCGEVSTTKGIHDHRVSIKRKFLQKDRAKKGWRWFSWDYYLLAKQSTNYTSPNYVEVFRNPSYQTHLAGSMYLLLSDFLTCALFFNSRTEDCELWVTRIPEKGKAINVSFCGAFVTTCNNKDARWYYNNDDCYKK